jgi:hypothetical protein
MSADSASLIEELPDRLETELAKLLSPGETVVVKLKGAFKEGLVCTDRRVLIVKSGFMTGQLLGNDVFQEPYGNIAGAQVVYHLASGYLELSAGGMANSTKSFWSSNQYTDPAKAPNCLSLSGKKQADRFRQACSVILERVDAAHRSPGAAPAPAASIPQQISDLATLRDQGILSAEEFEAKKSELLSRM